MNKKHSHIDFFIYKMEKNRCFKKIYQSRRHLGRTIMGGVGKCVLLFDYVQYSL